MVGRNKSVPVIVFLYRGFSYTRSRLLRYELLAPYGSFVRQLFA